MAETSTAVKFGTDGWRGIIADDFTYANVRVAARAIAHYVLQHENAARGVCIGYDTRFGSRAFAMVAAEVLADAGIPVALAGVYAHAGAELCGARAQGGRRRDDHVQPQSGAVEWREVQGVRTVARAARRSWRAIESTSGRSAGRRRVPAKIEEVDFQPGVYRGDRAVCRPGR